MSKHSKQESKLNIPLKTLLARIGIVAGTVVLALLITVVSAVCVLAYGPSEAMRNTLVLSAKQASATKWVPDLFLGKERANAIFAESQKVNETVVEVGNVAEADEWKDHPDGTRLEYVQKPKFMAYVMVVKDPERVKVGVSSDNFKSSAAGIRIFDMAKKYNAKVLINAGEFPDGGGQGSGARPIGITYSFGKKVWDDGIKRTFIGFDKNNKLICREPMTAKEAEELGIRDGVCFQNGNILIEPQGDSVKLFYQDSNTGTAQRTAIGQRADGTVIFIVTDGRSSESIGATKNDMIDLMLEYGAVSAGMLDGGSSTMLYFEKYWEKYNIDFNSLDTYQQRGVVNRYKAFTPPRRLPTYFIVL